MEGECAPHKAPNANDDYGFFFHPFHSRFSQWEGNQKTFVWSLLFPPPIVYHSSSLDDLLAVRLFVCYKWSILLFLARKCIFWNFLLIFFCTRWWASGTIFILWKCFLAWCDEKPSTMFYDIFHAHIKSLLVSSAKWNDVYNTLLPIFSHPLRGLFDKYHLIFACERLYAILIHNLGVVKKYTMMEGLQYNFSNMFPIT